MDAVNRGIAVDQINTVASDAYYPHNEGGRGGNKKNHDAQQVPNISANTAASGIDAQLSSEQEPTAIDAPQHSDTTPVTTDIVSSHGDARSGPQKMPQTTSMSSRGSSAQDKRPEDYQQPQRQRSTATAKTQCAPDNTRRSRPEDRADPSSLGPVEMTENMSSEGGLKKGPSVQERNYLKTENGHLKTETANLHKAIDTLQQAKTQLEAELISEKRYIEELENDIQHLRVIVNDAHSNAFHRLKQDVSTTLPDDKIKHDLRNFFEGPLLGWCMEFSSDMARPGAFNLLKERRILADETEVPAEYRMNLKADTTAAVLLKAALAGDICDSFLRDPFFLETGLGRWNEERLKHVHIDHHTTWRIQTCEFLEAAFPPSPQFFEQHAERFVQSFSCLMQKPFDSTVFAELVEIYMKFSQLALNLWKRKTNIRVEGLDHSDFGVFRAGQPGVETDSTVRLEAGSTALDGRPIHAMVRPRIVSEPVLEGGRRGRRIIWSNAVVWVAPEGKH